MVYYSLINDIDIHVYVSASMSIHKGIGNAVHIAYHFICHKYKIEQLSYIVGVPERRLSYHNLPYHTISYPYHYNTS